MSHADTVFYFRACTDQELLGEAARINREKYADRWGVLSRELFVRNLADPLSEGATATKEASAREVTPAHEAVWAKIQELSSKRGEQKKKGLGFLALSIASLIFFGAIHSTSDGLTYAAILLVALGVHELGHVIAMRMLGYEDVGILFIPFLGAFTKGKQPDYDARKQAVVSVAGPAMGLAGGLLAVLVADLYPEPLLLQFAKLSLYLNLFNLLPFWPLDGGKMVQETLFGSKPILSFVFTILGSMALLFIAARLQAGVLIYFSIMVMVGSYKTYRWKKVAAKVRDRIPDLKGELTLPRVVEIYNQVKEEFPEVINGKDFEKVPKIVLDVWNQSRRSYLTWKEVAAILAGSVVSLGALGCMLVWALRRV